MRPLPARPEPPHDLVHAAMERLLGNLAIVDAAADHDARTLPVVARAPADWPAAQGAADERYDFGAPFAAGGLGLVRHAEDRRLGRSVAVKELLHNDPAAARRFALEAMVTARLQHPGIVPLYDIGRRPDGAPYYCMKLVDGATLEARIAACEDLPARLALLEHVIASADAIAYAHREGVLHRDLKPANILVGEFGETVVIDWGLAKDTTGRIVDVLPPVAAPGTASDMTTHGTILGTLRYMPPEQARGDVVDARSDVFSLGAVLFHVLAGAAPHADVDDRHTLVARVLGGEVEDLRALVPEAPPELVAIARRAMDPEPARRYADADAFAEDLRRFLAGRLVGAHRYSAGEVMRRWLRRHRAVVGVAAVAVVVLAAGAVVAVDNIRRERDSAAAERDAAELARAEAARRADEALIAHARNALGDDLPAVAGALARLTGEDPGVWRTADTLAEAAAARGLPSEILTAGHAALLELLPLAGGLVARDEIGAVWRWAPGVRQAARVALAGPAVRIVAAADAPVWAAVGRDHVSVVRDDAAPIRLAADGLGNLEFATWHLTPDGRTLAVFVPGRASGGAKGLARLWDTDHLERAPITLELPGADVHPRVRFTPDLARIVVGGSDGAYLFDRRDGRADRLELEPGTIVTAVLRDHLVVLRPGPGDATTPALVDLATYTSETLAADSVRVLDDGDLVLFDADARTMTRRAPGGAVRWSRPVPAETFFTVDPTSTRFAVRLGETTRWAVGDLASGALTHHVELPLLAIATWRDADALAVTAGATARIWRPSAAPVTITRVASDCSLAPNGRVAVFAPERPEDGLQRLDLATGVVRPIACPRPPPVSRLGALQSAAIGVVADDLGRTFAVGDGWNCWADHDGAVEIPAGELRGGDVVALPGGGFLVSDSTGASDPNPTPTSVQLWRSPSAPAIEWTHEAAVRAALPAPTGDHVAVFGDRSLRVLHTTSGASTPLPLEIPPGTFRGFAWTGAGTTLGVLRSDGEDLELGLWYIDAAGVTPREQHRVAGASGDRISGFLAFTPDAGEAVFSAGAGAVMAVRRADGRQRSIAVDWPLIAGHFVADDRLFAVDMLGAPLLVDLAGGGAQPLLAPGDTFRSDIEFARAAPGEPLWICNALAAGGLVRWTDAVPDEPAAMQAWLRPRADSRAP